MIQINPHTKPANRNDAYAIVRGLVEQSPESTDLQSLMLYFAPKAGGKVNTAEQWVSTFAATKDIRDYLNYVYSDGTRLVATNGHILAWIPTSLPKGYYHAKTFDRVPDMDDIRYPDVSRVIPEIKGEYIPMPEVETKVSDCGRYHYQTFGEAHFDAKYLAIIAKGGNPEVLLASPNDAMRGKTDMGEFVIMPKRV